MSARPFLAMATLVVLFLFSWSTDRSTAFGTNRYLFGKPLDGLTLDQRKQFRDGQEAFEQVEDAKKGLGPIFNNVSCAACHSSPAVGGASPINETRAQRTDATGAHFELDGGSLFQSDAISPNCREILPRRANVVAQRQTTPLFGLGLVEAIPDGQLEAYAAEQLASHPEQAGHVNHVVDVATNQTLVGRFGWKCQQATLLSFSGDAYVNEMGITSVLFPKENAPNGDAAKLAACDKVPEPEDTEDDITEFTNFMRLLAPPPTSDGCLFTGHQHLSRFGGGSRTSLSERGAKVFEQVGCAVCHHSGFTAVSSITAINGETVDAFSDFLLHDVGTGDGIIQGNAGANELRTAPLWGVADSPPYLHDGSAPTLREAIRRHANQGAASRDAFRALPEGDQRALLAFLDSI
jgi:CxxC motif-containing protein (DUF1111 family)